MDKDIYGGVADSRPLRRHNPTLGAKEREERETSTIKRRRSRGRTQRRRRRRRRIGRRNKVQFATR